MSLSRPATLSPGTSPEMEGCASQSTESDCTVGDHTAAPVKMRGD